MPGKHKKKLGRPESFTPEIIMKLEQAFAIGASDLEACAFADVKSSTFYEYQKRHPDFLERKNRLKEMPNLRARRAVVGAFESHPDLALKYLERKKKDEFSPRHELEHSGNEEKPIVVIDAGRNPYLDDGPDYDV